MAVAEIQLTDLEKLLKEVLDGEGDGGFDRLIEAVLDHWVHFYFNEKEGSDTKPGEGNVEVVLFTGKDNPILLPLVEDEQGLNGVIYTNQDLAIRSAEFNCKIGKMRGRDAFKLFLAVENLDSIYIQGDCGSIRPSNKEFARIRDELH